MFGSELWWKGGQAQGTIGQANELQRLVNQESQATTGCFRATNLGALSMESGLRAATAQLEDRQRRFGLRLLSLPQGDQTGEIVGTPAAIGRRLTNTLAYARRTESTVLLEEPENIDAELLQEEERRPGLDLPYSRTGHDWTAGPPVARWFGRAANPGWALGLAWAITKGHAYGAECAALARALGSASRGRATPGRVAICAGPDCRRTDGSEEPGPRPAVRAPGEEAHRCTEENQTGYHHRDSVVSGTQGSRRQRKGRRMGKDCGRGARRPRGGMDELPVPGRGAPVGWGPDLQNEVQDAEEPEARWRGCWEHQEARLAVLPTVRSGWDIGSLVQALDGLHRDSPSSP